MSMRVRAAILGAFPFPYPQGSQIFAADHSRALARADFDVRLFTYGRGIGTPPDDLALAPSPRWLSPTAMRSGPTLGKLPADAALLATYVRAARQEGFDIAFAHNAEAALIAIAARSITRIPVIYVAHTILRHELSAYANVRFAAALQAIGDRLDRVIARHADGIIALSEDAREDLAPHARGPTEVIAPGLDATAPPVAAAIESTCAAFGLERDGFALYCGNLDGYQDLDLLAGAADVLRGHNDLPLVIATHDASHIPPSLAGLRCIEVRDFAQTRALIFASQSLVLCRRRRGGFPIKLLNYMEAGRPIVAFERVASGFEHLSSGWLLAHDAGARELAGAIDTLSRDAALREELGRGARALLETEHGWAQLAQRTRTFAETVLSGAQAPSRRMPIH
ncbi:MAG: glycosyltransferase family 4 protein [bacterium]|nr:glycosyltransferase family 4 protein [bacterium]